MRKLMVLILGAALLANTAVAFAQGVFVTKNGKKYHSEETCRWVKGKETASLDEKTAVEKGYKPCGRCSKAHDKTNGKK
jgi:hypothetical protein